MPSGRGMWEEVVGASLWISAAFHWILVDFFHVDLHSFVDILFILGLDMTFWDGFRRIMNVILHGGV